MPTPARQPRLRVFKPRNRRADLLATVGLFAVVFITHAGSLDDGLFFDDYWHRATLRELGWGFNDLIESATFDLRPGSRLADLWWQEQPLQWRYARPVAMLFMKFELLLSGGNPVGVHVCGLTWHALTTVLVYLLATWAIGHRGWAFLAGALFAFQPHSVFGVSWIAARNALLGGFFFLAAIYVYASASAMRNNDTAALPIGRLLAALVLWGLALLSRETAIIFPLLAPVLDLTSGGKRLFVRRLPAYAAIGLLAGAYLYWRLLVFPVASPPNIYFTAPSGPTYPLWAAGKLLHMLFALVFQTPLFLGLATAGAPASSQVGVYGVMAILVAGVALWYVLASRGVRARWFWPVWAGAAFVPVIPVFVMPHFAYLPAAAFAVMIGVMLYRLRGWWRPIVTTLVIAATLWSFGIYRYLWRGIVRSEQLIYADIRTNTPPPKRGAKLFFVNLPVAGIYAVVAMREAWGLDELEGYVLTFAPHPLMMRHPCVVEQIGDRELTVSTEPPGYFSGLSGRMLRDGMRPDSALRAGTVVKGELFDTAVVAGDEDGITKLKFTFHRPLDSDDFYFYVSSPERPAYRLRFDPPIASIDEAAATLFQRARAEDRDVRIAAREEIARLTRPLAIQTASPIQADLRDPQLAADEALDRVEACWRSVGASQLLRQSAAWNKEHAPAIRQRARYFQIDDFARRIIRSDLFLTGDEAE
ncbi:MAG: hypothetical protein ACE5I3_10720 [Phycisphaerae bacterium]